MRTSAGFHANQPDVYVGSEAQHCVREELLAPPRPRRAGRARPDERLSYKINADGV